MPSIGDKIKMHKGGICSKHKSQVGVIIKTSGNEPRVSYFIQFEDGEVEVHRKGFDVIG